MSFTRLEQSEWLTSQFYAQIGQKVPKRFEVSEQDHEAIAQVVRYFKKGEAGDKSLYLFGPCGCGKTLLMWLMQRISSGGYFKIVPQLDIIDAFERAGREGNDSDWLLPFRYGDIQVDDFLEEVNGYRFGKQVNVMDEFMSMRYRSGFRTHLTANAGPERMQGNLSNHIIDRMVETHQFIEFKSPSYRGKTEMITMPIPPPPPEPKADPQKVRDIVRGFAEKVNFKEQEERRIKKEKRDAQIKEQQDFIKAHKAKVEQLQKAEG